MSLAQVEIAYRQHDFDSARKHMQSAIPVFSKPDAEPYQKHALETLTTSLKTSNPR